MSSQPKSAGDAGVDRDVKQSTSSAMTKSVCNGPQAVMDGRSSKSSACSKNSQNKHTEAQRGKWALPSAWRVRGQARARCEIDKRWGSSRVRCSLEGERAQRKDQAREEALAATRQPSQ